MPIIARHTQQMPFVGTGAQKWLIVTESERDRISQAEVIRRALNAYFELTHDEFPPGDKRRTEFEAAGGESGLDERSRR